MELTFSDDFTKNIMDMVRKNWKSTPRTNVALTDLFQLRKAFFERKFPEPPTEKEVLYFLSGKAIEKGLGDLIDMNHPDARKTEGIWYNPDFRFEGILAPIELKSRRANLPREGEELEKFEGYVEQIFGYCTLDDVDNAYLVVFALSEKMDDSYKTVPMLKCYKFSCTKEEREANLKILKENADLLTKALETDDFSFLPMCKEYKCHTVITKIVEKPKCSCGKEFSSDYYLSRHIKKEGGHIGTFSKKEYTYEPQCKYYKLCRESG